MPVRFVTVDLVGANPLVATLQKLKWTRKRTLRRKKRSLRRKKKSRRYGLNVDPSLASLLDLSPLTEAHDPQGEEEEDDGNDGEDGDDGEDGQGEEGEGYDVSDRSLSEVRRITRDIRAKDTAQPYMFQ